MELPPSHPDAALFTLQGGVYVRRGGVAHRPEEYAEQDFAVLLRMQRDHFWYRGRHRFLLAALRRQLARLGRSPAELRALDLGAGCGGWAHYLATRLRPPCRELALADSSPQALAAAGGVVGAGAARYQVDLHDLGWRGRWDLICLLDVLEHVDAQQAVLAQIRDSLAPGGLLMLTVPALRLFWTANDVLAQHKRRYDRRALRDLAAAADLRLLDARYFMFWLSPLLLAARVGRRRASGIPAAERARRIAATHRVPARWLNAALGAIFAAETPLGLWWRFPWGTSLLGILQKP